METSPNVDNAWTNRPHWSGHQQNIQKQQQQDQQKYFPKTISASSGNILCATAVTTSSDTSTIANLRNEMADMKKAHTEMNDRMTRMEKSEGETKKTLTTIQTEQVESRKDLSDQINLVEKNMSEKLDKNSHMHNKNNDTVMMAINEIMKRFDQLEYAFSTVNNNNNNNNNNNTDARPPRVLRPQQQVHR